MSSPWGPMEFPDGAMLDVLRAGEWGPHGAGEYAFSHAIGPCAIGRSPGAPTEDHRQERVRRRLAVTAPPDSDIVHTDRVRLPDGTVCTVDDPVRPSNPFTGWTPFVRFGLIATE